MTGAKAQPQVIPLQPLWVGAVILLPFMWWTLGNSHQKHSPGTPALRRELVRSPLPNMQSAELLKHDFSQLSQAWKLSLITPTFPSDFIEVSLKYNKSLIFKFFHSTSFDKRLQLHYYHTSAGLHHPKTFLPSLCNDSLLHPLRLWQLLSYFLYQL